MQTYESLADLPEALPLQRVAPFWRVVAVLALLLLVGLVLVTCVLGIALLHKPVTLQTAATPVPGPVPPAVAPAPIYASMPSVEEGVDPQNLPYPVREDLRTGSAADKPDGTRRDRFLSRTQEAWQNVKAYQPSLAAVSPDGASLAFASGATLVAGPGSDLKEIALNPSGVVMPNIGGMRGRGMGFIVMPQGPGPDDRVRAIEGVPAWSSDSLTVFFARACGQLWRCDVATGSMERLALDGSSPVPLPDDKDQIVFVRGRPLAKADLPGRPASPDLTEVVTASLRVHKARVLVPLSTASWRGLAVSPDGRRLALVSDRGHENQDPRRWRVFVLDLKEGAEPQPLTPPARSVGLVCWSPDGKYLIYARSQEPPPAEYWEEEHAGPNRELDLFAWEFAGQRETRLSRGGSCYSPSMSADGDLYLLAWMGDRRGPAIRLQKIPLAAALAFAAQEPDPPARTAQGWTELAREVVQEAGLAAEADSSPGTAESLANLAAAFDRCFRRRFQAAPPTTVAGFDQLRREVRLLDLPPATGRQLALVLGATAGECLRQQGWAMWALGPGPLVAKAEPGRVTDTDDLFGYLLNPFRGDSLIEAVNRAQGRTLVLTNDPAAGQKAVERLTDPELDRAVALLKDGKEGAVTALLELCRSKKHDRNDRLAVYVGTLLYERGMKRQLLDLATRLCDREPFDARKYNLLGLALLMQPQAKDDPSANPMEAIDRFRNALRCDLKFGVGYLNLSLAYQRAGDLTSARQCLLRYLELMPQGRFAADAQFRLADLIR
jgi:tetratricopeptide (TPR) repeat protein